MMPFCLIVADDSVITHCTIFAAIYYAADDTPGRRLLSATLFCADADAADALLRFTYAFSSCAMLPRRR